MASYRDDVQELLSENTHRAAAPSSMLSAKLLSFSPPHLKHPGPRMGSQNAIIGRMEATEPDFCMATTSCPDMLCNGMVERYQCRELQRRMTRAAAAPMSVRLAVSMTSSDSFSCRSTTPSSPHFAKYAWCAHTEHCPILPAALVPVPHRTSNVVVLCTY